MEITINLTEKKTGNKNSYKLHDDSSSYRGVHLRTLYHLPSNKLQHSSCVLDASVFNSNQAVIIFFLKIVGDSRGCVKFVKGEWCWAMR